MAANQPADERPQVPETVAQIVELMSTFSRRWLLCGGWAVDAWLGRQTRYHGDVDIAVFEDDQKALLSHLAGWHLIAHDSRDPDATEVWTGRRLELPAHIHACQDWATVSAWAAGNAPAGSFRLEVILNERAAGEWLLGPGITLPWRQCIKRSGWGLPAAVPEVLCFYKATAYFGTEYMEKRPQDESDFVALLPLLSTRREWLKQAIDLVHPAHPWLAYISS
jgi:hypothetical protein